MAIHGVCTAHPLWLVFGAGVWLSQSGQEALELGSKVQAFVLSFWPFLCTGQSVSMSPAAGRHSIASQSPALTQPMAPGHRLARPLSPGWGPQVGSVTPSEQLSGHHAHLPRCAA